MPSSIEFIEEQLKDFSTMIHLEPAFEVDSIHAFLKFKLGLDVGHYQFLFPVAIGLLGSQLV